MTSVSRAVQGRRSSAAATFLILSAMSVAAIPDAAFAQQELMGTHGSPTLLLTGIVTNLGYNGVGPGLTGTISLSTRSGVTTSAEASSGSLSIGSPLGGSGPSEILTWHDTLLMKSVSASGDTIVWIAERILPGALSGVYRIEGGRARDQRGVWLAILTTAGIRHMTDVRELPRPDRHPLLEFIEGFRWPMSNGERRQ